MTDQPNYALPSLVSVGQPALPNNLRRGQQRHSPNASPPSSDTSAAETMCQSGESTQDGSTAPINSIKPGAERGTRSTRRPGRPRLDAPGAAVLSEDRRRQVRRAQKTYRQRKEAALQATKLQTTQLEDKLKRVTETFSRFYSDACDAQLDITNPSLFQTLSEMHGLLISDTEPGISPLPSTSSSSGPEVDAAASATTLMRNLDRGINNSQLAFGYELLKRVHETETDRPEAFLIPDIERPLSTHGRYTYSFREPAFSRRLQRFSLEYAFGLFSEPQFDPVAAYRIFRLVGCMQDRSKMYPGFRKLVRAGAGEPLEIPTLPHYPVGGAGTYFPQRDENGAPVYPSGMRLPVRILGLAAPTSGEDEYEMERARQGALESMGFGGEWFDCRDVEGYLQANGVDLQASSVFARVYRTAEDVMSMDSLDPSLQCQPGTYNDCLEHLFPDSSDPMFAATIGKTSGPCEIYGCAKAKLAPDDLLPPASQSRVPKYTLEIDVFLDLLLPGLAMLGRAPGFKRSVVESAFQSALRTEIFR